MVETVIKKHKVVTTLINNRFNQLSIVLTSFNQPPKLFMKNCSLKKYVSELLSQKCISKQFKVKNHCCCLTKNVTHNYLVCQMCMILIINNISKNYDLNYINIMDLTVHGQNMFTHF